MRAPLSEMRRHRRASRFSMAQWHTSPAQGKSTRGKKESEDESGGERERQGTDRGGSLLCVLCSVLATQGSRGVTPKYIHTCTAYPRFRSRRNFCAKRLEKKKQPHLCRSLCFSAVPWSPFSFIQLLRHTSHLTAVPSVQEIVSTQPCLCLSRRVVWSVAGA